MTSKPILKRDEIMEQKYAPFVRSDQKYFSWKYFPFTLTFWPRFLAIAAIIVWYVTYGGLLMIGHVRGSPMPAWKRWLAKEPAIPMARLLVFFAGITWI